jgi:hypothetical protein
MRKPIEFLCLLIGGLSMLVSVALLFFARYAEMLLIAGIVFLVVGFIVFSLARRGRSWPARVVLATLMLAVVGLCQTAPHWLAYVSAEDPPVVQVAEPRAAAQPSQAVNGAQQSSEEEGQEITLDELMKDHVEPALKAISAKKGYTATFHKREWARGLTSGLRLTDEVCEMKLRHDPLSVYLYFTQPERKRGTEAIYVEGKNGGNVIAHGVGLIKFFAGVVRVPPTDPKVMADNRYPITNIGMKGLLRKIQNNVKNFPDEAKAFTYTIVQDRKVDGRPCKCIEFFNPKPSERFPMASARLYIDREWNIPTGFESYERIDGRTQLVEQYRYTKLSFDPDFKDIDFDPNNPDYGYRR